MIQKQYPYLYETHLHTSSGSACGKNTPEEMVIAAKEAGYTGIIITEHNWGGNTAIDRKLPWEQWLEGYCAGYYAAKKCGESIGLDVFFGYEAGFGGTDFAGTEFLIYGISPEWLLQHPQIRKMNAQEHLRTVREAGAMVVHAHPYRVATYIPQVRLVPEWVDAVEAVNAVHSNTKSRSHYNPEYDSQALAYAKGEGLPITAGSDIHNTGLLGGGVAFSKRLNSIQDYCDSVMGGGDYVLTNGEKVFDRFGEEISASASWRNIANDHK